MFFVRGRRWLCLCVLALSACIPHDSGTRDNGGVDLDSYGHAAHKHFEGGVHFEVVGSESTLTVLVRRAGRLAMLGHNHVLVSSSLEGWVDVAADIERSSFALRLPIESLELDKIEARDKAGPEFSKPLSARDIAATRNNLLGERLLDVKTFPFLYVHSLSIAPETDRAGEEEFLLDLSITLKGLVRRFTVPAIIRVRPDQLEVNANFKISQQALGLQAFSILGGAIAVADELEVVLAIRADQLGSNSD